MLTRLLVVVLMLVGPMPFRVCTCAAGLPAQPGADHSTPATAPALKKSCGCEHNSAQPVPAHAHGHPADSAPTGDPADRHERDCPAADPNPVVRDAATPTAVDSPTDCSGPTLVVPVQPSQLLITSVTRRPAPPRAPKLPLYITLLSIRN